MKRLQKLYTDKALDQSTVCRWMNRLSDSFTVRENDEEEVIPYCIQTFQIKPCTGRPCLSVIPLNKQPLTKDFSSGVYIQTLHKLKIRILQVRPVLAMERVLSHHDNALSHTSARTRESITSMGWTALPHPPYSTNLAPSDYYLFGPLKSASRGIHHNDDNKFRVCRHDLAQKPAPRVLPQEYTGAGSKMSQSHPNTRNIY